MLGSMGVVERRGMRRLRICSSAINSMSEFGLCGVYIAAA